MMPWTMTSQVSDPENALVTLRMLWTISSLVTLRMLTDEPKDAMDNELTGDL